MTCSAFVAQLLAAAVAVTGCAVWVEASSGAQPAHIKDPPPCADGAVCVDGFFVEGTFHAISCGAVRPEMVTGDLVAVGRHAGRPAQVRRLGHVDPTVLLAVRLPGGPCGIEDRLPLSPWSMLLPAGADRDIQKRAICRVAVAEHLERNNCPRAQ
ncbi:MAG: hypothetical protein ACRDWY_16195 [Actinomycetes bacterium]